MIIGKEEVPLGYPSGCTFSSYGGPFLRVQLPDNYNYDNILISETFFDEMAKEMGYSKTTEKARTLKILKEDVSAIATDLPSIRERVDALRAELVSVKNFERRLEDFQRVLEEFAGSTAKPAKPSPSNVNAEFG